jgi:uncharacterized protein with von Willebrand factor type A (vWA) domain
VADLPDGRGTRARGWASAAADALRAHGVTVTTGQVIVCARALVTLRPGVDDPWTRIAVGRITLVSDREGQRIYDAVVPGILLPDGRDVEQVDAAPPSSSAGAPVGVDRPAALRAEEDEDELVAGRWAATLDRLRHRRFAAATDEERVQIDRAVRSLRMATPQRRSGRARPGRRGELDLPRTLERASVHGELLVPAFRDRRPRPRPLVLLLDVSGSMAPVARTMLGLAVAARRRTSGSSRRRVEVFAFGTRLTRITVPLGARDPDAAIAAAAARVIDWDGGTRIGDSIDELVRRWAPRGVLRGAVVVVCSDGLERGEPERLGAAAHALRRRCHRLIWVSPLAGDPRFEPRQRGLAAALGAIDVLLPGHDLASIEELARVVASAGAVSGRQAP